MAAPKKRIKLEEMKTLMDLTFREAVRDETGNAIMEPRKDSEGKTIMQVPRDAKTGNAIPNAMPEPVYQARTIPIKRPLPMLLKRLYLQIPREKLTRQYTIDGTRLFQNIADSEDGFLVLDEDVYDTVKEWMKNEDIGLEVFGTELHLIEQAMDNLYNREGEPKLKPKTYASKEEAKKAAKEEKEE